MHATKFAILECIYLTMQPHYSPIFKKKKLLASNYQFLRHYELLLNTVRLIYRTFWT